ncbi:potassium-transporting ATPase subunit F [Luteimonas sp. R10]|nr:potassium-transporting ATPase subunit F [Luteimonas sp. R10]
MPGWLAFVCGISVVAAAAYLLFVILRPEDF